LLEDFHEKHRINGRKHHVKMTQHFDWYHLNAGKGFPVYGFWAKKNLQKTNENSSLRHLFHRLPHEFFLQVMVTWKHSSESRTLHFRKRLFLLTGKRGNESEASKMKGWERDCSFPGPFWGEGIFSFHPTC